jgi:hypothetical protein
MITIKQWLELVDYRITEGNNYMWNCYGEHAHTLTSWDGVHGASGYTLDITFCTKTQTVFETCAYDYTNQRAYRMINPDYADAHTREAQARAIDMSVAWDSVSYVDLDVDEDFVEKATAIVAGQAYDTRVMININLDSDLELEIYRNAHQLDITVNQYIERALEALIEKHQKDRPTLDKQVWTVDVQQDANGDAVIQFPEDALKLAGWQEGDTINWDSNGDGSYTLTKV